METEDNLYRAIEELSTKNKKELNFLQGELSKIEDKNENNVIIVKDKKLKNRVAKFCLKLVNETGNHKKLIQETSYIIVAGFIRYEFGDDLDKVTSIAADLELPKDHVSGNVFERFKNMKRFLEKYLY